MATRNPWSVPIQRLAWNGVDLLFPPSCGGCGKVGNRWCENCQSHVPYLKDSICETCGIPIKQNQTCEKCQSSPPTYHMMQSWAVFDKPVQNAFHTLKYRRNIGIGDALAVQMKKFVEFLNWDVDLLVPVPLGEKRLKERGYNQVGLVANPLAYKIGLQYAPKALWKSREIRSQVGLSISQRRENVHNAYQADPKIVNRKSIL